MSPIVKADVHSVTHGRLRSHNIMYVRKSHLKLNRAFRVIEGHPYLCQQKSRKGCCCNVQLNIVDLISETDEDTAT